MAAANGPIKTILAVIIVGLLMCGVGLYILLVMGEAAGQRQVLIERAPISTAFHDHRVDRWTNIDLA